MSYKAGAIANYMLDATRKQGDALTPMKLQKLIYYAHGWYLAINGKPLINEDIQAWRYGPVVKSLYHAFKEYGSGPITGHVEELSISHFLKFEKINPPEDNEVIQFLDKIMNTYGKYTALQLSSLTHLDGTPWHKAYKERSENSKIENGDMGSYFKGRSKNN